MYLPCAGKPAFEEPEGTALPPCEGVCDGYATTKSPERPVSVSR